MKTKDLSQCVRLIPFYDSTCVSASLNLWYELQVDYYLPYLTSVYTQSIEIRESIPVVIADAEKLGYHIDEMPVSGGSADPCLAMLSAYRDADISPVPVRMVLGAVAPYCFYPEDWDNYGFDQNTTETNEAAAGLFEIMAGKEITTDLFGTPAYNEAMKIFRYRRTLARRCGRNERRNRASPMEICIK